MCGCSKVELVFGIITSARVKYNCGEGSDERNEAIVIISWRTIGDGTWNSLTDRGCSPPNNWSSPAFFGRRHLLAAICQYSTRAHSARSVGNCLAPVQPSRLTSPIFSSLFLNTQRPIQFSYKPPCLPRVTPHLLLKLNLLTLQVLSRDRFLLHHYRRSPVSMSSIRFVGSPLSTGTTPRVRTVLLVSPRRINLDLNTDSMSSISS